MCGIGGRSSRSPLDPGYAARLTDAMQRPLRRRGPDGLGSHHDREVVLLHRRLAIIDLTETGAQPLWNEDRTICVLVNGEIYNHADLRKRLLAAGHRFRGRSDSEVLVHLYEESGIDACCRAVEGMFAFALWDARTRDLFLVRDRLGIKPLVIAEHSKGVTFASALPALLADPAVPKDLREEALVSVLKWGFVPSPWSAIRAARRVVPGTWLRVREGHVLEEHRWWIDAPTESNGTDKSVRSAIEDAVRSHLVADVPVGVLLSAGIDSGIVTALAARQSPNTPPEAWTVSHEGFADNEWPDAARAAAHWGVTLHEIAIGERGLTEEAFEALIEAMDEPLAVSSLVGLHGLFRSIAPLRRVVLSGDGGDELFAGYDWHRGMPIVPRWARGSAFRRVARGLSKFSGTPGRLGVLGDVASHVRRHPASVYLDKLRVMTNSELLALGIDPIRDDPIEFVAQQAWDRFDGRGILEQMLAVDRATALVDEMLAKVDTAAMAYSVEARVPFLADRVVAAAKELPSERKRCGEIGKVCLRDWYANLGLPELSTRRKTGFNSPVREWVEGPAGSSFQERAKGGLALFGATGSAQSLAPRTILALAILADWVNQSRGSISMVA